MIHTPISNQTQQGNSYVLIFKPGSELPTESGLYEVITDLASGKGVLICRAEFTPGFKGEDPQFARFVALTNEAEVRGIEVLAHARLPDVRTILQNLYPTKAQVIPLQKREGGAGA